MEDKVLRYSVKRECPSKRRFVDPPSLKNTAQRIKYKLQIL
jgi:hypothetical protein